MLGIPATTIRYYERERLIPPPGRRHGRRVYGEAMVDRLIFVHFARRAGFGVREVRELVAGMSVETPPGVRWRSVADKKLMAIAIKIEQLEESKSLLERLARCHCATLHEFCENVRQDARDQVENQEKRMMT